MGFVSVNGPRETYFVDAVRIILKQHSIFLESDNVSYQT